MRSIATSLSALWKLITKLQYMKRKHYIFIIALYSAPMIIVVSWIFFHTLFPEKKCVVAQLKSVGYCMKIAEVGDNTLHIEIVEDYIPTEGELAVKSVNKNSDLTVWKNKGFAVKSLKSWCSNDADAFIVVDGDGRICYAVTNPQDGNGEPTSDTYYSHPYYTDYTTNPAIVISDTGYKVVVPEGGFAISVKGESLADLLGLILDPTIKDYATALGIVFEKTTFNENLRLSFDADKKIIKMSFN